MFHEVFQEVYIQFEYKSINIREVNISRGILGDLNNQAQTEKKQSESI